MTSVFFSLEDVILLAFHIEGFSTVNVISSFQITELEMCIYMMSGVCIRLQLEKGHQATVSQIINVLVGDEELGLPASAKEYFTLWMVSPLLGMCHWVGNRIFQDK